MLFKKSIYDFVVVGLGNPGPKYENTRHNIGWRCVDMLCNEFSAVEKKDKFHSKLFEGKFKDKRLLLVKPMTFMNNSGTAISEIVSYYKLNPEQIIIISDDVSMDVGRLRIRKSGSAGGHNGIKDIIELLGSDNIPRVKIGVGQKPNPDYDLAAWVLGKFSKEDAQIVDKTLSSAVDAVKTLVTDGIVSAMNKFNR